MLIFGLYGLGLKARIFVFGLGSGVETGGSDGSMNRGLRAPEGPERGDTKNKARK